MEVTNVVMLGCCRWEEKCTVKVLLIRGRFLYRDESTSSMEKKSMSKVFRNAKVDDVHPVAFFRRKELCPGYLLP